MAAWLKGRRVLAMAGIGRPQKFADTLTTAGAVLAGTAFFPDHHPYTPAQLAQVSAQAKALQAEVITTQKDAARLGRMWKEASLGPLAILPVTLAWDDEEAVKALLLPLMSGRSV
jgi:tetraacyldisaccharide 4'-kinase